MWNYLMWYSVPYCNHKDMVVTILEGCNIDYFMLRGGMLTFQVIEGYSCLDHVVLIGDTKKLKRCK